MRTLVIGDIHIDKVAIPELSKIQEEILQYDADCLVQLGDFYDKNRPTPKEVEFGTLLAKQWKDKFHSVYIISGNHDDLDEETSSIGYLQHMGLSIYRTALSLGPYFFGHFFVDQSPVPQLDRSKFQLLSDLEKDHTNVVLGHHHDFYQMSDKSLHLGSVRYVSFGESEAPKRIAMLSEKPFSTRELTTPVPIRTVESTLELARIDPDTKVRLVIKSFAQLKEVVTRLSEWKASFYSFKMKLDFDMKQEKPLEIKGAKSLPLSTVIAKWLKEIDDEEVRAELEEQFEGAKLL